MRSGWICVWASVVLAGMQRQERPPVVLVVTGADVLAAVEWSRARAVVSRLLGRAGVATVWASEGECQRRTVCLALSSVRPPQAHPDVAGYAVLAVDGSGQAAVYLPGVARTADQLGVDRGLLLGVTMAHEIGHVLLGPAHSRGVMSERMDWRQMQAAGRGELLFGDGEAQRLRAEAMRRAAIP